MSKCILKDFENSLLTGFIDKTNTSDILYQPELLVNKKQPPKKVLSSIIQELENCETFFISVAFVTTSGVATLINTFKELESKGIKGKILVSQYLNFTQPEALKRLLKLTNIELRIITTENSHSKGYIFKTTNYYNLIIGSSNLTANALSTNTEWNLKVSALYNSGLVEKVLTEFNTDFEKGIIVNEDFISKYEEIYNSQFINNPPQLPDIKNKFIDIKPNSMQVDALKNIKYLRSNNKRKALLISATGTGKTFLSAFDAKAFKSKKLLFVVHRRNIAEKSMESFKLIFGNERSMGIYSGRKKEIDKDFIFSTVQTISKQDHLDHFDKKHFDYIIIDESHRSGAISYRRLIEFFEPDFLLGMTATPERTDGEDIFSLFDHNIAYEIRLNRAMQEDMLSQFHYYGVSDLSINGEIIDDRTNFNLLTSTERIEKIIYNADFYGTDNGITRGLVFCSRKDEAQELSEKFNKKGYKTIYLSGDNSEEERVKAINRLESNDLNEKLDYIFTVDIFNEGVDIPKINQILMVRPTDSAIIFIQQLGRGLRKVDGKGYLTVIDFIGNYKNNYLIPIALYGDTSYNKNSIRKLISDGSRTIPGASTINFDRITKEQIFKSIDSANMHLFTDLKKDYNLLKYKLGRIPMMMDFIEHGSRDPFLYVKYSKSYFNFIRKIENEDNLNNKEIKLLELFSKEINNSKRVEESIILKSLILNGNITIKALREEIFKKYSYKVSLETIISCVRNLNFEFIREKKNKRLLSVRNIYNLHLVKFEEENIISTDEFKVLLSNEKFKNFLFDSTKYSIFTFNKHFDIDQWKDGFLLYKKYSRKDVFRILNSKENPVAQNVGGYMVSPDNKHCPIFVNYHKKEDISESTKYEDEFINNKVFDWMSKSNRKIESKDVKSILGKNGKIRLPLFIKKSNDEGSDFYYISDVNPNINETKQTLINSDSGKKLSVVKIRFTLNNPVAESMYHYLRENNTYETLQDKKLEKKISTNNKPQLKLTHTDSKESNKMNTIPFYNFYAAAGSFSEMQSEKNYSLVEVPEKYKSSEYFACKVIGESMNKVIPNGSTCIFKKYTGGTRNGKIVLVEHFNLQDTEFNSAFTIKTYSSEKIINKNGWHHTSIVLRPNSFDKKFQNIIITEENGIEMRVIGEFIKVLN